MVNQWKPNPGEDIKKPDPRVIYQPRNIVSEYTDEFGEQRVIHAPKGRALRRFDDSDTPLRRMNRAAAILLGRNIRAKREAMKMSLRDLCIRAGIISTHPKQYIAAIESPPQTRIQTIRMGTLYALCIALEVEPEDLLPTVAEVKAMAGVEVQTVSTLTSSAINGAGKRR